MRKAVRMGKLCERLGTELWTVVCQNEVWNSVCCKHFFQHFSSVLGCQNCQLSILHPSGVIVNNDCVHFPMEFRDLLRLSPTDERGRKLTLKSPFALAAPLHRYGMPRPSPQSAWRGLATRLLGWLESHILKSQGVPRG